ncbi:MAG TPA: hypothetical protein GX707_04225 [Epulopiscium sp.]|nr:hypothetical protein [Candidatus Epulonipiscium sp.]
MKNKNKLTNGNELMDNGEDKTAVDNQWVSVAGVKGYLKDCPEKTDTDNQWVSTNKNSK